MTKIHDSTEDGQAAHVLPFRQRTPEPMDAFTIRIPRESAQLALRFELFAPESYVPDSARTANGQQVRITVVSASMAVSPCYDRA